MSAIAGNRSTLQLAVFTDGNQSAAPSDFSATIDWGDGRSSAGTISPRADGFTVSGTHTYSTAGSYPTTITLRDIGGASATAHGLATVQPATATPMVQASKPTITGHTRAGFSGSVNPEGLSTTTHFIYGLDRRYRPPGFAGSIYDQTTSSRTVGSDFSSHPVRTAVSESGAKRSTTCGWSPPTAPAQPPAGPSLHHAERPVASPARDRKDGEPSSGQRPRSHSPPRKAHSLDAGAAIPLRHRDRFAARALELVAATGWKGKKYSGRFGGAVFRATQTHYGRDKGLTTLRLIDGRLSAPSYGTCKPGIRRAPGGRARAASQRRFGRRRVSNRTLQLLHASARGRFRTRGRYAAATVRGTRWATADRCDGTLIRVQSHTVRVTDLVKHISRLIHAGHRYLAKPPS